MPQLTQADIISQQVLKSLTVTQLKGLKDVEL